METTRPPRLLLIGAGRVGTAVATLLTRANRQVAGVSSRTRSSAEAAAQRLGCEVVDLGGPLPDVDLYLLGVPDPEIEDVARALAPHANPEALAVHFAGSLGTAP